MVELFLGRHSLRQDAELQLYIFLVSVSTPTPGRVESSLVYPSLAWSCPSLVLI